MFSPSCDGGASLSDSLTGYGYAWTKEETPPEKIASFYDNVSRITGDMAQNGVTADELSCAKTPIIERPYEKKIVTLCTLDIGKDLTGMDGESIIRLLIREPVAINSGLE